MGLRMTDGIDHKVNSFSLTRADSVSSSGPLEVMLSVQYVLRNESFVFVSLQHWELFSPQLGLRDVFDNSTNVRDLLKSGRLILDDR